MSRRRSWPAWTPPTDPFSPLPGTTLLPTAQPTSDPTRIPTETGDALPTRIVIPSLGIDLPVVDGDTRLPAMRCRQDPDGFAEPGHRAPPDLYGHARAGHVLPPLDESEHKRWRPA